MEENKEDCVLLPRIIEREEKEVEKGRLFLASRGHDEVIIVFHLAFGKGKITALENTGFKATNLLLQLCRILGIKYGCDDLWLS